MSEPPESEYGDLLRPWSELAMPAEPETPVEPEERAPDDTARDGSENWGTGAAEQGMAQHAPPTEAGQSQPTSLPNGWPQDDGVGRVLGSQPFGDDASSGRSSSGRQSGASAAPRYEQTDDSRGRHEEPARSRFGEASSSYGQDAERTKIGLWGSTGSGKTTYLAALRHAVSYADGTSGNWTIVPRNDPSERLLLEFSRDLVRDQKFPQATRLDEAVLLEWLFIGGAAQPGFVPRRSRRRRSTPVESQFLLNLVDVSGEAFKSEPDKVPENVVQNALDHLAQSQGLIYLFDALEERNTRSAADFLDRTLTQLVRRTEREGRMVGRYLPHYISVCVTKFDDTRLFQQARDLGLVSNGPDGLPRVRDEHAERFFDSLCEGRFWQERDERSYGSAMFVRDQLRNHFHPDRIRYYVSSSIGFRKPPGWDPAASARPGFDFNPDNFANAYYADGEWKIHGPIHPINVLEPLIALQQRLSWQG